MFLHADGEDSDQTERMPMLIFRCAHIPFVGFIMKRLISRQDVMISPCC